MSDTRQMSLARSSRSTLERRVRHQQTALVRFFEEISTSGAKNTKRCPVAFEPESEVQILKPMLHRSLFQPQDLRLVVDSNVRKEHLRRVSEEHAQQLLRHWTATFHHTSLSRPRKSASPSREVHGTKHTNTQPTLTSPLENSKESRPSHLRTSSLPPRVQSLGQAVTGCSGTRDSPLSFPTLPSSTLKDPPFVVVQARLANRVHQATEKQIPKRTTQNADSDTKSDHSSLASVVSHSDIAVTWRRSALHQHWDFENNQLIHNTGCLAPEAAKADNKATTQIRKKLLRPEALDELKLPWEVVQRKVTDRKGSQHKKFVSIHGILEWPQVESLIKRSSEYVALQAARRRRDAEQQKNLRRVHTELDVHQSPREFELQNSPGSSPKNHRPVDVNQGNMYRLPGRPSTTRARFQQ